MLALRHIRMPPCCPHRVPRRCLQGGAGKADVIAPQSVTLISAEGDSFQVDGKVAAMSELVKTIIGGGIEDEDGSSNGSDGTRRQEIPLPNVSTKVLRKVIEYCEHHVARPVVVIQKPLVDADMKKVGGSIRNRRGAGSGAAPAGVSPVVFAVV